MNPNSGKNWRAGASVIAGLLVVIAPYRAAGQAGPVENPSNIECLERLEMPDYPPLARMARITGIQTVKVLLSDQATVQTVESSAQGKTTAAEKDFKESAEKALKNSRFSKTCGGKTITLVFHYEFREDDNKSIFAFAPPNHFWIRLEPEYLDHAPYRRKR
jgi:hypothetical protein